MSRHKTAPGFGHALLAPSVADAFRVLDVSAALYSGVSWGPIHVAPSLNRFEVEHGSEGARQAYNELHWARLRREKKTIRAERGGYFDSFVPVIARGEVVAALVTGPFALARATSAGVLERWRGLAGRQGHPADPEFAAYLSATLATLVLDQEKARAFEKLAGCWARLTAGEGDADAIANEASALRLKLDPVRSVERSWEAVRSMLDERSLRTWSSAHHAWGLQALGLSRVPDHVLVGLTLNAKPELDPVDAIIRRDAFQRSVVDLGREVGGAIAGRVGDQGVVFLLAQRGEETHKRRNVLDLAQRAASIASRRLGLTVRFGVAAPTRSSALSRDFQTALGAAESALAQGTRVVIAATGNELPPHSLRQLREDLVGAVRERGDLLGARFERYLESVAVQSGYRMELARGHLEAGFERVTEPLVGSGGLDRRSFRALCDELDRAAIAATTINDLFAAYRRAVADVSQAVERPVQARQDRSLRAAVDYIHQHYGDPLSFKEVARVAGFYPTYFSKLFRMRENVTFERYLRGLRLERAKQLLSSTDWDVARIAALAGFGSPNYFHHVFRRELGKTPLQYRRRPEQGTLKNRIKRRAKARGTR